MSGQRKRRFGPLLYSTLILAVIATAYSAYSAFQFAIDGWIETRSQTRLLLSSSSTDRDFAASLLVRRGPEVAGPPLLEAARDPRPDVRALGCRTIGFGLTREDPMISALVVAARDPESIVRIEAARGLEHVARSRSGASTASPPLPPALRSEVLASLHRLLKDPSTEIRNQAAVSLAGFGPDAGSAAALAGATEDPDEFVRLNAAKALLAVDRPDNPAAVRTLTTFLSDREPSTTTLLSAREPSTLRLLALEALRDSGPDARDRAVAALARMLAPGEDDLARHDVIECLMKTGPWAAAAIPALEGVTLDDDPELRSIARLALVAIEGPDSPKSIASLVGLVADQSAPKECRQAALESLRERSPASMARATPSLIRQLGDPASSTRVNASELLSQIVPDVPAEMPAGPSGK